MTPERHAAHVGFTWGLAIGFLAGVLLIGGLGIVYGWLTGMV